MEMFNAYNFLKTFYFNFTKHIANKGFPNATTFKSIYEGHDIDEMVYRYSHRDVCPCLVIFIIDTIVANLSIPQYTVRTEPMDGIIGFYSRLFCSVLLHHRRIVYISDERTLL